MTARAIAIASVIIVAVAVVPAAAQPTPGGTAAEHFERGRRLYDVADYPAAIAEFKQAYTLDPDPGYLFNIAQAYRLDGDCESAAEFFHRYLKADPASTKRAKIDKLIAECKPREATTPPPTDDTTPVTGAPSEPDPPVPPATVDRGRRRRTIGLFTAGGGVLLLAAGTVLAINVSSIESDIEDQCNPTCNWDDVRGLDDTAHTRSTLSKVAFITGGVAVIGGTALYLWGRSLRDEPTFGVVPTAGGAIATAHLSF